MNEDALRETLRRVGLRATPQRIRLLRLLSETEGKRPVSAEQFARGGKGAFDLTTTYRTLDAFVEKGLARCVELGEGRALFELAGDHHHHAVCTSCGTIRDVSVCVPSSLPAKARSVAGFARIDAHRLDFFGLCRLCVKK